MKVGLVQFSPIWEDKNKSMEIINKMVKNIDSDVSILIFPEMTLTGFTMNSKEVSEEIDGQSIKYFIELASRLKIDIIAGIVEKIKREHYNSLFHFTSDGLIKAVYRKIHPFTLANENEFFNSGKETVISTFTKHKIGLSICYDLRFPELYRIYAKDKVELLVNIANWPVKRISHWKTLLKARAIENQSYMIGVNRVGNDPFQTYNGCSAVFNPIGDEIILCENEEKIFYADLDLNVVKDVRSKLGFLDDIKMI